MKTTIRSRFLALASLALASCLTALGQTSQGYMNDLGNTPYGINIPVENGFINISNGNLHLEFPIAGQPQRGALGLSERLVYDSRIWLFLPFGSKGSYHWWPKNVTPAGGTDASGGWRFIKGNETGTVSYQLFSSSSSECTPNDGRDPTEGGDSGQYSYTYVSQILWTDPNGTTHPFNSTSTDYEDGCGDDSNHFVAGGPATDGSGYSANDDGSGYPVITDNSGNQVYPQVIDRYGNYFSGSGDLVDSTGRMPVLTTQNGNTTYYDVLAPNGPISNQGTRVRYTVTTTSINVSTDFVPWAQSDIHQWVGTLNPVQSIVLPDGSSYTFSYDADGGLSSVTLPTGGKVSYGYTNIIDSSNTENRWLTSRTVGSNPAMTFTTSVVTSCVNYGTGCVEQVNLHKPSGDETVYKFTLVNGAWNTGTTAYTGSASNGQQLSNVASVDTYTNGCSLGSSVCTGQTYVSQSTSTTTVYGSQNITSQTQTAYDLALGKVDTVKEWGFGASFTGTPTRQTDYSYTGLDLQQVTVISNGGVAGQTNYGYTTTATATSGVTQHGSQNAGGPYLQTVSHALLGTNPAVSSTTTYGMDDTGQVISISDPNGNPAATTAYQCANSLPYQAKNPLGQITQSSYDCNSGAVTGVQDPNDLANSRAGTTYSYESVAGRPQKISYPDGGQTSYSYPSTTEVDTTVLATPNPSISSQDIVDGFGRKSQHIQNGVSSETSYDANGRVNCTTNPHTGSAANTDGSTCTTAYDGLDRPLTQQQQDGTTLGWTYSAAAVTSTDEAGNAWQRTSDAFGRLIQVVEPGNLTTTYAYDGLGNLQSINQAGVAGSDTPRVRTFVYDSLGRLTNECHPEGVAAGQTCSLNGPWSTTSSYYPNGNLNLNTQTDARGISIGYTYDALNRPLTKKASDSSVSDVFYYDKYTFSYTRVPFSCSNGIGRLCFANRPGYSGNAFNYDAMGRTSSTLYSSLPTNQPYVSAMAMTYDLAGDAMSIAYPDGRTISNSWDASGRLATVGSTATPGQSPFYLSGPNNAIQYTAAGAEQQTTLGNGISQTYSYNNRFQLCEHQASMSGSSSATVFDKQYFFGTSGSLCASTPKNNGNIQSIVNSRNAVTEGFSYDSLNRLQSASRSDGLYNQTYNRDSFGNMVPVNNLYGSHPNLSIQTNNRMQLNVSDYGYDAAGNMINSSPSGGGHTYTYDGEGHMLQVDGGQTPIYGYNGLGERAYKYAGSAWTEYVYLNGQPMAEHASDGTWTDYVYANGKKIAKLDGTDTRLHFQGTAPNSSSWVSESLPNIPNYQVRTGDKLFIRQYQSSTAKGGPVVATKDANGNFLTMTAWTENDQDGQISNDDSYTGQWHNRMIKLDRLAGGWLYYVNIDGDQGSSGNWTLDVADISIVSADGSVISLYNGQNLTLGITMDSGDTNVQQATLTAPIAGTSGAVHYYVGDQVGTAQLEFSGGGGTIGGWPVWKGDFAPFGQELDTQATLNRYRFTGLEHDQETGLDHTQFRQYASTVGRWMSPDPYDGSMDLGNPQSLNRYSYAANNPLRYTDPSGLRICDGSPADSDGPCSVSGGNPVGIILTIIDALSSFFGGGHPSFHGSLKQRPGGSQFVTASSIGNPTVMNGTYTIPTYTYGTTLNIPVGTTFSYSGTISQFISAAEASGFYLSPGDMLISGSSISSHQGVQMRSKSTFCNVHVVDVAGGAGPSGAPTTGSAHYDLVNPFPQTPDYLGFYPRIFAHGVIDYGVDKYLLAPLNVPGTLGDRICQ